MGMLALALGVRLGKPGVYTLNGAAPEPGVMHTEHAIRICSRVAWLTAAISAAALAVVGWPS
jgi:adenosylcobinamide-phosphate synthase